MLCPCEISVLTACQFCKTPALLQSAAPKNRKIPSGQGRGVKISKSFEAFKKCKFFAGKGKIAGNILCIHKHFNVVKNLPYGLSQSESLSEGFCWHKTLTFRDFAMRNPFGGILLTQNPYLV